MIIMTYSQEQPLWPPAYRLRKSRRAKYLQLKVCPEKGLEVVVPYRFGHYDLEQLFATHRPWIEKRLKIRHVTVGHYPALPTTLPLLLTGEVWRVERVAAIGRTRLMARPDETLILLGDQEDVARCQLLLKQWLRAKATELLVPMLKDLSLVLGLPCQKITIREQKSRWGSCASNGNIALNSKLIFLPAPLVRYVLIHELCHTRHFNHSKRFWGLVAEFDPQYLQHRREINTRYRHLGCWGLL